MNFFLVIMSPTEGCGRIRRRRNIYRKNYIADHHGYFEILKKKFDQTKSCLINLCLLFTISRGLGVVMQYTMKNLYNVLYLLVQGAVVSSVLVIATIKIYFGI